MRDLLERLHRHTDPRAFALFRILVGSLLFYEMGYYLQNQLVEVGIVGPKILFPYPGLEWLRPFGLAGMKALLYALAIACLLIVLGLFYRFAIIFFFLGFSYLFLLDRGYYNNHFYLFMLLSFIMIFAPADRAWSLDRKLFQRTEAPAMVPYWSWLALRLQIVIVYLYGGIAKIGHDWLVLGEPVRSLLEFKARDSAIPGFWTSGILHSLILHGGLLFDLAIGPLLWYKPTRRYALPFVLFFNVTNHMLFDDIGVFPFFMIAATIVFFEPEEIARALGGSMPVQRKAKQGVKVPGYPKQLVNTGLAAYFSFQLLFPLRWMLLPADPDRTTIGQRFSWRMKINTRDLLVVAFFVEDQATGEYHPVQVPQFINNFQAKLCADDPRATIRFAKYLKEEAARRGMPDARITSRIIFSYNGRPYRYLFPPEQDLSLVDPDPSRPADWIPSLEDPALELPPAEVEQLRSRPLRNRPRPIGTGRS